MTAPARPRCPDCPHPTHRDACRYTTISGPPSPPRAAKPFEGRTKTPCTCTTTRNGAHL